MSNPLQQMLQSLGQEMDQVKINNFHEKSSGSILNQGLVKLNFSSRSFRYTLIRNEKIWRPWQSFSISEIAVLEFLQIMVLYLIQDKSISWTSFIFQCHDIAKHDWKYINRLNFDLMINKDLKSKASKTKILAFSKMQFLKILRVTWNRL